MRTFYTGSDIEDLAASGVKQLEVGPGVVLTDTAREQAEELGVALLIPGSAPSSKAVSVLTPERLSVTMKSRVRESGCR